MRAYLSHLDQAQSRDEHDDSVFTVVLFWEDAKLSWPWNEMLKNSLYHKVKDRLFLLQLRRFISLHGLSYLYVIQSAYFISLRTFLELNTDIRFAADINSVTAKAYERAWFGFGVLTSLRHNNIYSSHAIGYRAFCYFAKQGDDRPRRYYLQVHYFIQIGHYCLARADWFVRNDQRNDYKSGLDLIDLRYIHRTDKWVMCSDIAWRVVSIPPPSTSQPEVRANVRLVKHQNRDESNILCW